MGYNTDFLGTLDFIEELTASQIVKLRSILGEDCREHPEWKDEKGMTYIDLKLTDDFSGIEWDNSEKSYDMPHKVKLVVRLMRETWPEFKGVKGKILAQGEDIEDRWELIADGGSVVEREVPIDGIVVECPHCGEKYVYN